MDSASDMDSTTQQNKETNIVDGPSTEIVEDTVVDMSEGVGFDMFGVSPFSENEVIICFSFIISGVFRSCMSCRNQNILLLYRAKVIAGTYWA